MKNLREALQAITTKARMGEDGGPIEIAVREVVLQCKKAAEKGDEVTYATIEVDSQYTARIVGVLERQKLTVSSVGRRQDCKPVLKVEWGIQS